MLMYLLLLLMPIIIVFTVVNIALGCYIAVRLGYGPPNWQSALNLIVRLTTLQNCLNAGRYWLDDKYPKAGAWLDRLRIPKPLVIVDTTPIEEEPESVAEEEPEPVAEEPSEDVRENDEEAEDDEDTA